MLYKLLFSLHDLLSPLNVFRYITFRTALSIMTAMILSLLTGPAIIDYLRKISVTQQIRDDGPQTHMRKSGTPTMGGIIIIVSILITVLIWGDLENMYVWVMICSLICFSAIGLLDDYLKVIGKNPRGLRACYKFG